VLETGGCAGFPCTKAKLLRNMLDQVVRNYEEVNGELKRSRCRLRGPRPVFDPVHDAGDPSHLHAMIHYPGTYTRTRSPSPLV